MKPVISYKDKSIWKRFSERYPRFSALVFQFAKFYFFSLLVTVLQYLLLTFLPRLIHTTTSWMEIPFQVIPIKFWFIDTYVFNHPVTGLPTGGLGYFIAFAVTLFIAQCINFPMQRNITFKSNGNVAYQLMWYFVAWVLITVVCSFLASIYVPILEKFLSTAVYNIIITVVNGGVQMVIYFPIYRIIFRENKAGGHLNEDA